MLSLHLRSSRVRSVTADTVTDYLFCRTIPSHALTRPVRTYATHIALTTTSSPTTPCFAKAAVDAVVLLAVRGGPANDRVAKADWSHHEHVTVGRIGDSGPNSPGGRRVASPERAHGPKHAIQRPERLVKQTPLITERESCKRHLARPCRTLAAW